MEWIISFSPDIAVDGYQLQSRREYIHDVTYASVSEWSPFRLGEQIFLSCISSDNVDGIFITSHTDNIEVLCLSQRIGNYRFVVANTCVWIGILHKDMLQKMKRKNEDIELLIAKQELSVIDRVIRRTSTVQKVGGFDFQTTQSERDLFRNKDKGLEVAIRESFERVSPIVLSSDLH